MNLNLIMYGAFALTTLLGAGSISALNAAPRSAVSLPEEPAHGSIRAGDDESEVRLARRAILSAAQAEQAVTGELPGRVIGTELEVENRFLVWEVKSVANDGTTTALYVDAGNGEILAMEREDDGDHEGTEHVDRQDDDED